MLSVSLERPLGTDLHSLLAFMGVTQARASVRLELSLR